MAGGDDPITTSFWIILGGALATGLAALTILIVTIAEGGHWLAFAVPGVGIVLFLGVSMLGHYTNPDPAVAESALRHGLAAGFVGAYLTILGLSLTDLGADFSTSLVKHLTYVVGVVVTFYFGSTTASQLIQSKAAEAARTSGGGQDTRVGGRQRDKK